MYCRIRKICTIEAMEQLAQGAMNFIKEKIAEMKI